MKFEQDPQGHAPTREAHRLGWGRRGKIERETAEERGERDRRETATRPSSERERERERGRLCNLTQNPERDGALDPDMFLRILKYPR